MVRTSTEYTLPLSFRLNLLLEKKHPHSAPNAAVALAIDALADVGVGGQGVVYGCAKVPKLVAEGDEAVVDVEVGLVAAAVVLPRRWEEHRLCLGWCLSLADVHEQAELSQMVVDVVGTDDEVLSCVEE